MWAQIVIGILTGSLRRHGYGAFPRHTERVDRMRASRTSVAAAGQRATAEALYCRLTASVWATTEAGETQFGFSLGA